MKSFRVLSGVKNASSDRDAAQGAPAPTPRHRQGLRKISPDLLGKAREDTADQVNRIGLTFFGTAAFCLLSLFSPDIALLGLGGSEKIEVPLAGPVSFSGFMLLGPAVLIMLRVYLQFYVEHSNRLERLVRSVSVMRVPTFVPLQNPLIRVFGFLIFYLLLPATLLRFAWKAAVFPAWGAGLFAVAVAVIASHVMLLFSRVRWRSRGLLSAGATAGATVLASWLTFDLGPMRRPFDLAHANLAGQWLVGDHLRNANLSDANLSGAHLSKADLSRADLYGANLSGANLSEAKLLAADLSTADLSRADLTAAMLGKANLRFAKLANADLWAAHLNGADLNGANLSGASLWRANLSKADLSHANLTNAKAGGLDFADLSGADLSGAHLDGADLSGAFLTGAKLGAYLNGADLRGARDLTPTQLDGACGNSETKLPEVLKGLTLKACP